jgi:hypothetical protein
MKWPLVTFNVLAAVVLVFLESFAVAAHRTHALSTYQELKKQEVLIERPGYESDRAMM